MGLNRNILSLMVMLLIGLLVGPTSVHGAAYQGYTLFGPNGGTSTYLVNMSNTTVKQWSSTRQGGYTAYLLNDGTILRTALSTNSNLNGGGAQGIVQRIGSSNNVLWEYTYSNNSYRAHHDIEPMPNGNVLLIAWERKTAAQAVQAGLDSSVEIWPDHLVEVQPSGSTGGTIVWEWHAWDHLIQDYDPTKDNYGVVGDHPELLDINLGGGGLGGGDWMHTNGISYDAVKDQIVISSHNLNEIWVIDHSTTTAEAAGHTGGNAGKGGDILYRWGRPANYDRPGAAYFDVVHCGIWVEAGLPGSGNLMAFNNRDGTGSSIVCELVPPYDGTYNYSIAPGQAYGPAAPTWTYSASGFYSQHLGSCQRLPNGNTFACEATSGIMWEVDAGGAVQWSYNRGGEIAMAWRYGDAHPGIAALGLSTGVETTSESGTLRLLPNRPNPFAASTVLTYRVTEAGPVALRLFDPSGRLVRTMVDDTRAPGEYQLELEAAGLASGTYLCRYQAGNAVESMRISILR